MSSIKNKNTSPELKLRKLLSGSGIKGYRLHPNIPGRPDIVFSKKRLAIFVNGCYWHRCPKCFLPIPKSNQSFWQSKFENNIARDKRKINELKSQGWNCLTVWECDLKKNPVRIFRILNRLLLKM